MHAIASMVRALREQPKAVGLVAANGGFLSKYSVGVYSAAPASWRGFDNTALQGEIDAWESPAVAPGEGEGVVETYTIDYSGLAPVGVVVGRLDRSAARFVARTDPEDASIARRMAVEEPLCARVTVARNAEDRSIIRAFSPEDRP
jgi:acetyl-CoA C-acetyltransferase